MVSSFAFASVLSPSSHCCCSLSRTLSILSPSSVSASQGNSIADPNASRKRPTNSFSLFISIYQFEHDSRIRLDILPLSGTATSKGGHRFVVLMDDMACAQVPPIVRKGKKKQGKDELDRQKQAEKKRRRLEKALATSAAIRSELEKKKQKKKEEQQRLDEEGAAIAEAVALHVLIGEDSEDSCKIRLKKGERFNCCDHASNIGLFMGGRKTGLPHQGIPKHCIGGLGLVPNAYGPGCRWSEWGIGGWSLSPGVFSRDLHAPYYGERGLETTEISAGLIAAQAVSSLQIAEDGRSDAIVINGMLESKF